MLFNSPELESVTGFENVTRRYPLSWPKMTIIYSTCGTGHHHITALGNGSTTMVVCEDGVMGTVTFKSGSNVKLPLFSMAPLFALVVPLLSVKFPMVTRTPLMIKNILFFFSASIMVPVWPWPIMFMVFVDGYAPRLPGPLQTPFAMCTVEPAVTVAVLQQSRPWKKPAQPEIVKVLKQVF